MLKKKKKKERWLRSDFAALEIAKCLPFSKMALPDVGWNTTTIKSDKEGIRLTDPNFYKRWKLNMQHKSAVKGRDRADRTEKKLEGEKKEG